MIREERRITVSDKCIVLQGDYLEKWYVKFLTVTSITAVKCILPLLFDSPSYMLFVRSKQFPSQLHAAPQQSDVMKQNATKWSTTVPLHAPSRRRPSSYMGRRCAAGRTGRVTTICITLQNWGVSPTLPHSQTSTFLNAKSIRSISIMKIPQQMENSSLTTYLLLLLLLRILHTI
jgi:hypothetical protein